VIDIYKDFAYLYDRLIGDIDYSKWADRIEDIFKQNNLKPSLVLDLGCGTGSFCIEMAKRNYDMIGIDISSDMLSCAKTKSQNLGLDNILYLNQSMSDFELYGTVDAIVCLLDSVNYLTSKNDLKKMFKLVKNYLNPGGLFIFDINSEKKLSSTFGNNLFYEVSDDMTCLWQNRYDSKKKICEFDITMFVNEDGKYARYDEIQYERAYSIKEITDAIKNTGLSFIGKYENIKVNKVDKNKDRIFFVCGKR
jgi:cyclopropane fatty-acyl-phospholipid synthase-like methyltransferase